MPPSPAPEVIGHLGGRFNGRETEMEDSPSTTPATSDEWFNVNTPATSVFPRKRRLSNMSPIDNIELSEHKRKRKTYLPEPDQLFACPYYKMDRIKHLNCFKRFRLKRIKDLKQHLHRKHSGIECLACGVKSPYTGVPYRHPCPSEKLKAVGDAMSFEQRRAISARHGSGLTEVEQWFRVWRILFPEQPEPFSPWLGTELQEVIQTVRQYWTQNSHSMVANARQRSSIMTGHGPSPNAFGSSMTTEESLHEFSATVLTETMDIVLEQFHYETGNRVLNSSQSPSINELEPGSSCQTKNELEVLSSSNSRGGTQDPETYEANVLGAGKVASAAITTRMDFRLPLEAPWITKPLACPYFRYNSVKHLNCFRRFQLRRVKDVKQHLYRKHCLPLYYCPRCWVTFTAPVQRDNHINGNTCHHRDRPEFEGISVQQKRQLNQRPSSGSGEENQWFQVWDILFPGTERPATAYLGNEIEEVISTVRMFWNGNRSSIVSDVISCESMRAGQATGGSWSEDSERVTSVMETLLSEFESKSKKPSVNEVSSDDVGSGPGASTVSPALLSLPSVRNARSLLNASTFSPLISVGCDANFPSLLPEMETKTPRTLASGPDVVRIFDETSHDINSDYLMGLLVPEDNLVGLDISIKGS